MKKTLALLVASTALSTAICLPAWSAMRASFDDSATPSRAALLDDGQEARLLVFVSDDDSHDDDDDDDDNEDECDDDDDGDCGGAGSNPAPTGTIAPPQNGLFGSGAPPQVQSN